MSGQQQKDSSSSNATTSKDGSNGVNQAKKAEEEAQKTLPQLGALEEDDEFEEVRPLLTQGLSRYTYLIC